jgi:DNA-binding NtrC family response regulator
VVILGESGTGKSLVVKVIHQNSSWTDGELHHFNCRDLEEHELQESLRDLMSDPASPTRQHTIHLENIHAMSARQQTWLAGFLENNETQAFRLVASSNKDPRALTAEGKFNNALYYALGEVTIHLPALRERFSDLSVLIRHFLKNRRSTGPDASNSTLSVDPQVPRILQTHDWPHNLRELRHVIEQAATVCNGEVIKVTDLPRGFLEGKEDAKQYLPMEFTIGKPLHDFVREVEQRYIEETLRRFQGNRHEAAQALGISQATLYRKMDLGRKGRSTNGNGTAKRKRRSA